MTTEADLHEAALTEQIWQERARATRRLNRRAFILGTLLPLAGWAAAGIALLASLLFVVFFLLFHGVTTPV